MKKIIIILASLLLIVGCSKEKDTDASKFKKEYEDLNSSLNSNNVEYKNLNISKTNPIKYATYYDIMEVLNGTGIIYFGFPECPWCRNMVPVLLDAANDTNYKTIYYYNILNIRDKKHLDKDGNIVIDNEGTQEYKNIVSKLYNYLGSYTGLNDESIKRLYAPTVVFVKDGEVVDLHVSTVSSQKDPYTSLTNSQYDELFNIYSVAIHKVLDDLCDESC